MSFRILSPAMQVAEHLKAGILRGRWRKAMPGVITLSAEMGVNRTTIEAGLRLLEKQGLLVPRGAGKAREIVLPEGPVAPNIRVTILLYRQIDTTDHLVSGLRRALEKAGFNVLFASRSLEDMGMRPATVAKLIDRTDSHAWIVVAGSRGVLEHLAARGVPAFAMFGQRLGVKIAGAGPNKLPALESAVRRLLELGHRKICLLVRHELRKPEPGPFARTFMDMLTNHGIAVTPYYHLPEWEENGDGLRRCLDTLFRLTPPTALIMDEAILFQTATSHLARNGILSPQHVSLVCTDPDPSFAWADPPVAHIHWEPEDVAKRVVRWINHVAQGQEDKGQTLTRARFIEGGTIGPAPFIDMPK